MGIVRAGRQILLETVYVQTPQGNVMVESLEPCTVLPDGTTSFIQKQEDVGDFTKTYFAEEDLSGLILLRVVSPIEVPVENEPTKRHLLILVK